MWRSVRDDRIDRRDRNLARRAMSDRVFPAVTSGGAKFSDRQPRQSDLSSGFRREMRVAPPPYVRETTISYVFENRPCLVHTYVRTACYPPDTGVPRKSRDSVSVVPTSNPCHLSVVIYLDRADEWCSLDTTRRDGGPPPPVLAAAFSRKYTCRR